MKLKVGDWATNGDETFLILKIEDYPITGTTHSEESYIDIYYQGHITYHCDAAEQKDIEKTCLEMLELKFK